MLKKFIHSRVLFFKFYVYFLIIINESHTQNYKKKTLPLPTQKLSIYIYLPKLASKQS